MATEVSELPHLVVVERLLGLPVIESALTKSAETYSMLKNLNQLVKWTLTTAETSLSLATKQAIPIAMPIARRLGSPINFVDDKLCWGLDKIEENVPLMREKSDQMLQNVYVLAVGTIVPAMSNISYINNLIIDRATLLRDTSHKKTNEMLETYYGNATVKGIDNAAEFIDQLIDKFFPAIDEKELKVVSTPETDKLLHIIQTLGNLSLKAARRIYVNILHQLKTIKKEYLVPYIFSVIDFLHFTSSYLRSRPIIITTMADKKIQTNSADTKKEELQNGKKEEFQNGTKEEFQDSKKEN